MQATRDFVKLSFGELAHCNRNFIGLVLNIYMNMRWSDTLARNPREPEDVYLYHSFMLAIEALKALDLIVCSFPLHATFLTSSSFQLSHWSVSQSWFDVCIWSGFSPCQNFQFYFIRITNDVPHPQIHSVFRVSSQSSTAVPPPVGKRKDTPVVNLSSVRVKFIKALRTVWSRSILIM